jgi:hypothetical protein
MTRLLTQSYVLDPRPDYPFLITTKRHVAANAPQDGLTLLFTHGTGFHKECWEPAIQHLYDSTQGHGSVKIRECWTIDAPNHGESAVLNEKTLRTAGYDLFCGFYPGHSRKEM